MFLGSVTPAWHHAAKGPCCGVKHGNRKDPWSSNVRVVGKFSKIIIIIVSVTSGESRIVSCRLLTMFRNAVEGCLGGRSVVLLVDA